MLLHVLGDPSFQDFGLYYCPDTVGSIRWHEQYGVIAKVRPTDSFVGSKRVIGRQQNENTLAPECPHADGCRIGPCWNDYDI
nr:hypothetical protein [Bradyrhizobium japonicum]